MYAVVRILQDYEKPFVRAYKQTVGVSRRVNVKLYYCRHLCV